MKYPRSRNSGCDFACTSGKNWGFERTVELPDRELVAA